jgi:hypothetical protein
VKEANREVLDRGTLPAMLATRARHASDRRLVVDAVLGLTTATAVAVLRPPLWMPLSALAFCLGAFGVWGILDREVEDAEDSTRRRNVLVLARSAVAVVGGAAAVLFGVSLFFGLLGPWIS